MRTPSVRCAQRSASRREIRKSTIRWLRRWQDRGTKKKQKRNLPFTAASLPRSQRGQNRFVLRRLNENARSDSFRPVDKARLRLHDGRRIVARAAVVHICPARCSAIPFRGGSSGKKRDQ